VADPERRERRGFGRGRADYDLRLVTEHAAHVNIIPDRRVLKTSPSSMSLLLSTSSLRRSPIHVLRPFWGG
jgi:hypothetical protein